MTTHRVLQTSPMYNAARRWCNERGVDGLPVEYNKLAVYLRSRENYNPKPWQFYLEFARNYVNFLSYANELRRIPNVRKVGKK